MSDIHGADAGDKMGAIAKRGAGFKGAAKVRGEWLITCRDKNGKIKWTDTWENRVVNEGLNHLLDVALSGAAQITSWFVGLTDGTPTDAAGDTMAVHAGWVEVTAYTAATRVAWVDGGVSALSVDNSAAPASFLINANGTVIGGAFLVSNGTKGGATGVLYAVGAFSAGDKSLDSGDTLDVTATFTQAAA